ncbi:MAG: hypothetical protein IKX79_02190 [Desulfovibrionaceae bacterium]|nr:hypothetical protein [Desulfovibrionaceae bacterium]
MHATWFFDKADRDLLRMVNSAMDRMDADDKPTGLNLHPHGILELATTHEFRVARAVANLLGSLSAGQAEDRLSALQTVHDEVLHSARTPFRYNTGRVLVQIMKEIVRSRSDRTRQLMLMHDFRKVASGNPRIVRHFLTRHHLLEMPEEWNQLTMDHHVHDANTKGRKNPTHLIMDAWIKGIRFLCVIYYNFVEPAAARELLRAAEIMGISVRIGIEFQVVFRRRFVNFVWAPRGFTDTNAFLSFLDERSTRQLMDEGRKATQWVERHVLMALTRWNTEHRLALMSELGMDLPPLGQEDFLAYVHTGQASELHLAEYIHRSYLPLFKKQANALQQERAEADPKRQNAIDAAIRRMDSILPETILSDWLNPGCTPELACLTVPDQSSDMPEIMRLPPPVLMDWAASLRSGCRITLQLASLAPEDVLELLWDAHGLITHLELFNLKEWQAGALTSLEEISRLQQSINDGSVLHVKRIILDMTQRLERSGSADDKERLEKFKAILRGISTLQEPYRISPLGSQIGTDSTSNSNIRHGMGLAVLETLPKRTARALASEKNGYCPLYLPVHAELTRQKSWSEPERVSPFMRILCKVIRRLPGLDAFGMNTSQTWSCRLTARKGSSPNIVTMGGLGTPSGNGLCASLPHKKKAARPALGMGYLNTRVSDWLKVIAGFLPAQLAFYLTQTNSLMIWGGAAIWFAITGIRNIPQAVYGGGGRFWTTSMLRWNNYVSWSRICDSLLYTGISVLLLEWGIRVLLLEKLFSCDVSNHPVLVFTIIAAANSVYIAWHNIYRGFPRSAVIGNLFRSALAIPLSIAYFDGLCALAAFWGSADPAMLLQPGAAIISKAASDTVACIIEAIADRNNNRRLRLWDYTTKIKNIFDGYARLELRFPDNDVMDLLKEPGALAGFLSRKDKEALPNAIADALDLMYFWLYQPYAQQTLRTIVHAMTQEERLLLERTQDVLLLTHDVSLLFVEGLVGSNFAMALSFYLSHYERYVEDMHRLCSRKEQDQGREPEEQELAEKPEETPQDSSAASGE